MGNSNKPIPDDLDKDGIPDSNQSQGSEGIKQEDEDAMPGREAHATSNPIIIND